jgi:hypothetical protein
VRRGGCSRGSAGRAGGRLQRRCNFRHVNTRTVSQHRPGVVRRRICRGRGNRSGQPDRLRLTTAGRFHVVYLSAANVVTGISLGTSATGIDLSTDGTRGFVTLGVAGVAVIDLSLLNSPWIKSSAAGCGGCKPRRTLAFLRFAFVENGHRGLFPQPVKRPLLLGRLATAHKPQSAAAAADGRLFGATNSGGLIAEDICPRGRSSPKAVTVFAVVSGLLETRRNVPFTRDVTGRWKAGDMTITVDHLPNIEARCQFSETASRAGRRFVRSWDRAGALLRLVVDEPWRIEDFAGFQSGSKQPAAACSQWRRCAVGCGLPCAAGKCDAAHRSDRLCIPQPRRDWKPFCRHDANHARAGAAQPGCAHGSRGDRRRITAIGQPPAAANGRRRDRVWQFSSADVKVALKTRAASLLALTFGPWL